MSVCKEDIVNESFEEIQLSPSVVDSFVEKVKGIQTNLASSKQEFASSWEGSTRVHLDEAITLEDTKLEELLARLASMKNLLSDESSYMRIFEI